MAKPSPARHSSVERTAAPSDGLALRELLAILRRRRRVIFWVTAMVTTVAVLIGLQVTKTYTATAQVMIEPRESQIIEAEKVAPGLPAEDNALVETHIKLIQSRATPGARGRKPQPRVRSTVHPEPDGARPFRGGPVALLAAWLPDWVADQLPVRWALAAGIATEAPGARPRRCCATRRSIPLQGDVKVTQSGRSYVLWISYTSPRPARGGADRQRHRPRLHRRAARREALGYPPGQRMARRAGRAAPLARVRLGARDRGVPRDQGLVDADPAALDIARARGPHELADRCAGRALRQGSAAT